MAMNQNAWGPAVRAAVQGVGITDTAKITQSQLDAVWIAITGAHRTHLTDNMEVLPDTLNNPTGQAIAVTAGPGAGSTGATSAPQVIDGIGKVQ